MRGPGGHGDVPPEERTRTQGPGAPDAGGAPDFEETEHLDSPTLTGDSAATAGAIDERTLTEGSARIAGARPVPESIGEYRIIRPLGEGGMGVVYEAEQQHPRRRVALKVIRGAFVDDLHVRLFEREIESLARLKHSDIAAIYESGVTGDGQHWFAMELVRGVNLDVHLAGRPGIEDRDELHHRLRMFKRLCEAVHHAHLRGVIHRDLKPNNIVVSEFDDTRTSATTATGVDRGPGLKVLDFGVARVVDSDVAGTVYSDAGMLRGTLPYMSPEQADGDPADIDQRADVYALGVILYEMLKGRRPYDLSGGSIVSAIRTICETPPDPLRADAASRRAIDSDLELICLTALQKDPAQRYSGAASLAEDVERYLTSLPILARRPSIGYQLRKLVARHRLASGLAAGLLVALVGFSVGMTVLFGQAQAARRVASEEATLSGEVTDFMIGLFEFSDPDANPGETVSARKVLDQGIENIDALSGQPELHARMLDVMATAYRNLGLNAAASDMFGQAAAELENALGSRDPRVASMLTRQGGALLKSGRFQQAKEVLDRSLEIQQGGGLENDPDLAGRTLNNAGLCAFYLRDPDEAVRLHEWALRVRREGLGEQHPDVATSLMNLASAWGSKEEHARAVPLLESAIRIRRRTDGPDHPRLARLYQNLAKEYRHLDRPDEAVEWAARAIAIYESAYPPGHSALGRAYVEQGKILRQIGRPTEALAAYERADGIFWPTLGADHRRTFGARLELCKLLAASGQTGRARDLAGEALAAATDPRRVGGYRKFLEDLPG